MCVFDRRAERVDLGVEEVDVTQDPADQQRVLVAEADALERLDKRRLLDAQAVSESKTVGRNVAKSLHTDRIPRSPARFASWQQGQLRAAIFTSPRVAKPPSRLI